MARVVILRFVLDEEVTPEIFVKKVAVACSKGGAIRPGERVTTSDGYVGFRAVEPVTHFDTGLPFPVIQYIEAI